MADRTIYNSDFSQYLPLALKKDPKLVAFADLARDELIEVSRQIKLVLIYTSIDSLPEEILDIIAFDMHCDWYDYNYPLSTKRKVLKRNIKIHRKLGTKYAVEKALMDVYGTASVEEWFEYNGMPFHFRVKIDISNVGIDENTTQEIEAKMKFYKNARSHCEGIFYALKADHEKVKVSACLACRNDIRIGAR